MNRQRGLSLLLSLLLLTTLSLLALAAASDGRQQLAVSAGLDQSAQALQAAESALAWAEDWLLSLPGDQRPQPCDLACADGDVIRSLNTYPLTPEQESSAWWQTHGALDGANPVNGSQLDVRIGHFTEPARWIVEEAWYVPPTLDGDPGVSYYRVIARGGMDERRVAVAESILARPWGDASWSDGLPSGGNGASFCRTQELTSPCGRLAWRQRR